MPCGLVSEVHSAFLWAVELQSLYCRRTPSATEQLLGFFFGSRKISLQILRFVGRVWNEGSRMLCQRLPSPSTTTRRLVLQNLPSLGLPALIRPPPIWRVLNKLHCERLPIN